MVLYGHKVYLDVDFISRATNIPCRGGVMLDHLKTPKVEKIEMVNKICGKK